MGIFKVSHEFKNPNGRVFFVKNGFLVFLVDARRWPLFNEKKQRVKLILGIAGENTSIYI